MAAIVLRGVRKEFSERPRARSTASTWRSPTASCSCWSGPRAAARARVLRLLAGLERPRAGRDLHGRRRTSRDCDHRTATSPWSSRTTRSTRTRPCARTWPSACACAGVRPASDRRPGRRGRRDRSTSRPPARSQARASSRAGSASGWRSGGRSPAAARLSPGRAALQPRRQAARPDPHRAGPAAAASGRHHGLRHPRSGRGDDPGRSGRRHAPGQARAGRPRRWRSTSARPAASSPASWARPR